MALSVMSDSFPAMLKHFKAVNVGFQKFIFTADLNKSDAINWFHYW